MTDSAVVYVVDDDASVRRALTRLIKSVNLHARVFSSAQDFLDSARMDEPSCLILDVRMPGLSGLDLQKMLRSANLDMPVVFITGHGNVPMSVRAMKNGASDFLEKPFDDQDLLDAVHKALDDSAVAWAQRCELEELQKRVDLLTPREYEVFCHVVSGMLNKQVAFKLGTSEKTIKVHRARVMTKMKVRMLADLVRLAEKLNVFLPKD